MLRDEEIISISIESNSIYYEYLFFILFMLCKLNLFNFNENFNIGNVAHVDVDHPRKLNLLYHNDDNNKNHYYNCDIFQKHYSHFKHERQYTNPEYINFTLSLSLCLYIDSLQGQL